MDELMRVHTETVNRLRELAEENHRTMTTTLDLIVEAEYLKTHPAPLTEAEALEKACEQ